MKGTVKVELRETESGDSNSVSYDTTEDAVHIKSKHLIHGQ